MALGFIGYNRYKQQVSQVYCDQCASERIYPMLHETLYRVGDSQIMLCELHAILAKRRPPTPGFREALEKAMQKARAERVARLANDLKAPHSDGAVEVGRVPDAEQQSSGTESSGDKQGSCVE